MKQKYSKCPSCGFATLYTEPQRSEEPQEWTPEMVAATLKDRPFAASTIASHHNAALAAERERYEMALSDSQRRGEKLDELTKQIAAEREKAANWESIALS